MKKYIWLLMALLVVLAAGAVMPAAVAEDACDHQWGDWSGQRFSYYDLEETISPFDDTYHAKMRYNPTEQCELCGATRGQGEGAGSLEVHSYDLVSWEYISNGSQAVMQLQCRICEYECAVIADVQDILDGTGENCLSGGECPMNLSGSMYPEGIAPSDGSRMDDIYFAGVVEVPCTDEANHYYLASRTYCPVCGRPDKRITQTAYGTVPESWLNTWKVYTEEAFLTADMPVNLPYQAIDQIRAGAAGE